MTPEHVLLLRRANVWWWPIEWGAPGIDPKRPIGNGDLMRDIYEALGADGGDWDGGVGLPADLSPREWKERCEHYGKIYAELEFALQIVLVTGMFEPGVYIRSEYGRDWAPECTGCRHAVHTAGRCGVNVGTGYMGHVPCACTVDGGIGLIRVTREDVGQMIDGVASLVDGEHRDSAPLLHRLQALYAEMPRRG